MAAEVERNLPVTAFLPLRRRLETSRKETVGTKDGRVNRKHAGPANLLLHAVMNQLTAVVGNCDLMSPELREGSQSAKRSGLIHEAAIMAEAIKQYQVP